jgi:hypothetical protein
MNRKLNVLSLDYETSPAKGYFFGRVWETNIIEIIEYEQILCVGYKWNNGPVKTIGQCDFKGYKKDILNDKELVKFFGPMIARADIVSAHNGDRFDNVVFNTRLLVHKMSPIPINKSYDTKKMAKAMFHLPSNKLDDIADFLGIGRKLSTFKSLWFGCEHGDPKSWKYMKKYCGLDVALQHEVLMRILPFTKQSTDAIKITERGVTCINPLCKSLRMNINKKRIVKGGYKLQYQCSSCGSYWTDPKMVKNEQTVKTTNK